MVSTLILDLCKRLGTIYFQMYFSTKKRDYTYSNYGKNSIKEALETAKFSASAGKCSHWVNTDTELSIYCPSEGFSATLVFAQWHEPTRRAAEQSASALPTAPWSGPFPETHLKAQERITHSSSAKRANEVPKTGRENFFQKGLLPEFTLVGSAIMETVAY